MCLQRPTDHTPNSSKKNGLEVADVLSGQESKIAALAPGEKEDEETRRIVRKIDVRLLPVLATIYSFALIDRVNLPNVSHSDQP